MRRSEIELADYNPREIAKPARQKLKAGLKAFGLVQPLIWNKRSRRLVAGHQRIQLLDEIEGGKDYTLPVSVVDLSDREERKLNILLNNPKAQGKWDQEKLGKLIEELQGDLANTGFDAKDFAEQVRDLEGGLPETWQILLDLPNEAAQTKLLARLTKEGITCRALTS